MKAKRRLDYTPPLFTITETKLEISLDPTSTRVKSVLKVVRQGKHNKPLVLDGQGLNLEYVAINGREVHDFSEADDQLVLDFLPDEFELSIINTINPEANTALEGLYLTDGAYCTQCEAEGFRRITYYLDRPDVLSVFTVSISADEAQYPYILSNGNKVSEQVEQGVRTVVWHDPYPKPCYLFALVAGDFDLLEDSFITASNREVKLELFVDKGQLDKAPFAMQSLKRAMKWDEDTFNLEYDLDIYMIVAVDFFNMGAMENKGLNVFNSKFILANDSTATDADYFNIESVVAHEYFHNWTGNRVTCRDWFQLSLKEGLTVFRDQLFSADMSSELTTRIDQVRVMREHQFPEDASAMSHPIRPDEVLEMNNFYTVTVYDKGAEVIRMLWNSIGEDAFKTGLTTYFERHDGQAVTCDDFVDAMQSATDYDLTKFKNWYSQSGTPTLAVEKQVSADGVKLLLSQHTPATADQPHKLPLPILLNVQCYDENGQTLRLVKTSEGIEQLATERLVLFGAKGELEFEPVAANAETVATVLGNFSSPVLLSHASSKADLIQVALNDSDAFNRWDACQQLYSTAVTELATSADADLSWLDSVFAKLLEQAHDEHEKSAEYLAIPSIESLIQQRTDVNVVELFELRQQLCRYLASTHFDGLLDVYNSLPTEKYRYQQEQASARRLRKSLLMVMAYNASSHDVIESLYASSDNMTDSLAALSAAQVCDIALFNQLMTDFEIKWREDSLVIDKWFGLHATADREDILSQITLLQQHPRFALENPNRVRALVGSFAFYNKSGFHHHDGSGYRFLTDYLLKLDGVNPQVAARMVTPLTQFQNLAQHHQSQMREQLSRLLTHKSLSKDVFEKVSKALAYDSKP